MSSDRYLANVYPASWLKGLPSGHYEFRTDRAYRCNELEAQI